MEKSKGPVWVSKKEPHEIAALNAAAWARQSHVKALRELREQHPERIADLRGVAQQILDGIPKDIRHSALERVEQTIKRTPLRPMIESLERAKYQSYRTLHLEDAANSAAAFLDLTAE